MTLFISLLEDRATLATHLDAWMESHPFDLDSVLQKDLIHYIIKY